MSFEALGLGEDADEREVRRAYARLLKKTRPDDDPVAFQALTEAYQDCLQQLRWRAWQAPEDDAGEEADEAPTGGAVASEHAPAPSLGARPVPPDAEPGAATPEDEAAGQPEEAQTFDFDAFLDELFLQADRGPPAELRRWLEAQPALYSISLKSAIAVQVLHAVADREPMLSPPLQDVVTGFFGLEHLGPSQWSLVEHLGQRRALAEARDRFKRGYLPHPPGKAELRYFDRVMDAQIAAGTWRWRSLLLLLVPGMPSRLAQRLDELEQLTAGASRELVHPRLRTLAGELANRERMAPSRLLLTWTRAALVAAALSLLSFALAGRFEPNLVIGTAIVAATFTLGQLLLAAWFLLQRGVERRGFGHRWRETSALGLMLLALASEAVPGMPAAVGPILAVVASLRALTLARFNAGYALTLLCGALALLAWTLDVGQPPVRSLLLALLFPGAFALAVDRVQSLVTGRPVDELAASDTWLLRACGLGLGLALVVGVAGALVGVYG